MALKLGLSRTALDRVIFALFGTVLAAGLAGDGEILAVSANAEFLASLAKGDTVGSVPLFTLVGSKLGALGLAGSGNLRLWGRFDFSRLAGRRRRRFLGFVGFRGAVEPVRDNREVELVLEGCQATMFRIVA